MTNLYLECANIISKAVEVGYSEESVNKEQLMGN